MSLSKPNEKASYRNQGSFSQPFRPTGYPPSVNSPARVRDSGSSSPTSKHSARSSTSSAKLTDYEIVVRSILDDIGTLNLFASEPRTDEPAPAATTAPATPPASEGIPGATLLNTWRKEHRKELIAGCFNTETRKVRRGLHAGLISSPLEAGRVDPDGIQGGCTFPNIIASETPFGSFRAYDFAPKESAEEEKAYFAHLTAQVNRARAGSDAASSVKGGGSRNSNGAGARGIDADVGPVGPAVEDLTPEKLSAIRRQNSEEYGCSNLMPQGPQSRSPEISTTYKSPGNSMDPINVLSHPHESNPNPAPASVDAAGKLQQLLSKTTATEGGAAVGGGNGGGGGGGASNNSNESSPESLDEARSIHSTKSLRFAKGIVSGLFGRGKRCASDDISRSPTNSIAGMIGVAQEQSKGGTLARKRIVSPRLLFQKPTVSPPRVKMEVPEIFEDMSDMPDTSDDDVEGEFSVLTLVDKSRNKSFIASPGATLSSVVTKIHAPLATLIQPETPAEPPLEMEASSARPPSASRSERKDTESLYSISSSFQIPAGSIIRQSSPSSFVTKTPTTKFARQRSRKSGVVALTNVLSSPTYRRQITSLTPIDEYKLADVAGYQSFPPFVPSSGLGALFGNSEEGWGSMKRFPSFRKKRAGGGENVAV